MAHIDRKRLVGFKKNYALLIGIDDYHISVGKLRTPVQDAEGLKQTLLNYQGYEEDELTLLANPTKSEIEASFQELKTTIEPAIAAGQEVSFIFYYAGHGLAGNPESDGPAGYFVPKDAAVSATSLAEHDGLLAMDWVTDQVEALRCHHSLLILDCCFAGAFRRAGTASRNSGFAFRPFLHERFMRYRNSKAFHVLVSAGPKEKAADFILEGGRDEGASISAETGMLHSPFAKVLIEALADHQAHVVKPLQQNLGDGVLTIFELFLFLFEEVEALTRRSTRHRPQHPDLFPFGAQHEGGQFVFVNPRHHENNPRWSQIKYQNPYKGLSGYDVKDAGLYFGRRQELKEVRKKLAEESAKPITIISGHSGSGKSSFVKAGLLPGYLPEQAQLFQCQVGKSPFRLFAYDPEKNIWKPIVQENPNRLFDPIFQQAEEGRACILLLDKYEQIYTILSPEQQAQREFAIAALFNRANEAEQIQILMTIRSDALLQLKASKQLGLILWTEDQEDFQHFPLDQISIQDLRSAIVGPAGMLGYSFQGFHRSEENLVDIIIDDLKTTTAPLPLLSQTMHAMVKHTDKEERKFLLHTYQSTINGVEGILRRTANTFVESLREDEEESLTHIDQFRTLFLRMLDYENGGFSRRVVPLSELDFPAGQQQAVVQAMLRALVAQRLIILGVDQQQHAFLQLADDVLLKSWSTGQDWILSYGRDRVIAERQLTMVATEWMQWNRGSIETFNGGQPKDVADQIVGANSPSLLWDQHPRLQQLMYQLIDPRGNLLEAGNESIAVVAYQIWNHVLEEQNSTLINSFLSWLKDQHPAIDLLAIKPSADEKMKVDVLLDQLINHGSHTFNRTELAFLRSSWEKREDSITKLQIQLLQAQVRTTVTRAINYPRKSMARALRLLQSVWDSMREQNQAPLPILQQVLAQTFYQQFASRKFNASQPLPYPVRNLLPDESQMACCWSDPDFVLVNDYDGKVQVSDYQGIPQYELEGKMVAQLEGEGAIILEREGQAYFLRYLHEALDITLPEIPPQAEFVTSSYSDFFLAFQNGGVAQLWRPGENDEKQFTAKVITEDCQGAWINGAGDYAITWSQEDNVFQLWDEFGNALGEVDPPADSGQLEVVQADYAPGIRCLAINWKGLISLYQVTAEGPRFADVIFGDRIIGDSGLVQGTGVEFFPMQAAVSVQIELSRYPIGLTHTFHFSEGEDQIITYAGKAGITIWNLEGERLRSNTDEVVMPRFYDSYYDLVPGGSSWLKDRLVTSYQFDDPILRRNGVLINHHLKEKTLALQVWNHEMAFHFTVEPGDGKLVQLYTSPNHDLLVGVYEEGHARVWNKDGKVVSDLTRLNYKIEHVIFDPDSQYILTQSDFSPTLIWPIGEQGRLLADLSLTERVSQARFSYHSPSVLLIGERLAIEWRNFGEFVHDTPSDLAHLFGPSSGTWMDNTEPSPAEATLRPSEAPPIIALDNSTDPMRRHHKLCISPFQAGTFLLANGMRLMLHETDTGTVVLEEAMERYQELAFVDEGKGLMAATGFDVFFWELRDGKWVKSEALSKLGHRLIATSLDHQFLVSIWDEELIILWERKADQTKTLKFEEEPARILFRPGQEELLLGFDYQVQLWSWRLEEMIIDFHTTDKISSWAISKDGTRLFVGCQNGKVELFDVASGQLIKKCFYPGENPSTAKEVLLSPSDTYFLTRFDDHLVCLRDRNGHLLALLDLHESKVEEMAFSAFDEAYIITRSQAGRVRLWPSPKRIYQWVTKQGEFLGPIPVDPEYK